MEPVEINTGEYYLRQLRADRLMDDRPALIESFADAEHRRYVLHYRLDDIAEATEYVALRAAQWDGDERCSWAIAEPTTGDLLGEVGLKDVNLGAGTADAAVWVRRDARGRGVATAALDAALRFGFGALGLVEVTYRHEAANSASAAVARNCGFRFLDTAEELAASGEKVLRWSRVSS